jgi:hypothetical protein
LQFVVRASSVSISGTIQKAVQSDSELHIEFIEDMIRANVQVEPLTIFEAVRRQLLKLEPLLKSGKVRLRGDTLFEAIGNARSLMDYNIEQSKKVQQLIEEARKRAKLTKVPPKGKT